MIFFFFIAVILAIAALVYPYVAVAFCRYRMLRRFEKIASKVGFRLHHLHKGVIFSPNSGEKYDILIEAGDKVYALKLWSAVRKNTTLRILGDKVIAEERTNRVPMEPDRRKKKQHVEKRKKKFPAPQLPPKYRKREKRTILSVLLIYPSYSKVIAENREQPTELHSGDRIGSHILLSPSALEKILLTSFDVE